MLISKKKYTELEEKYNKLKDDYDILRSDSGYDVIKKLRVMAREAGLDPHSPEYQDLMTRVFMHVGGRECSVLKQYSGMTFINDYSDDDIKRAIEFAQQNKLIGQKKK